MEKLEIIKKKYLRNLDGKKNTVYFKIGDKELEVDILYVRSKNQNFLIDNEKLTALENILQIKYEQHPLKIQQFNNYLLHKLRIYSNYTVKGPDSYFYPDWIS